MVLRPRKPCKGTPSGSSLPPPPPPIVVASVTVTLSPSNLIVGQTAQATVVARTADGVVVPGRTVTWASSFPSLATVSSSGLVTAVAAGNVVITATIDGISGSAPLAVGAVVLPPPPPPPLVVASVTVSIVPTSLIVGQTAQATAVAKTSTGTVVTGRTITWSVSNPNLASISGSGLVTTLAAGNISVSATIDGVTGSTPLGIGAVVTPPPPPPPPPSPFLQSFSVAASSTTPPVGTTVTITAQAKDQNNNQLNTAGIPVAWTKIGLGGSLSVTSSTTDANGRAVTQLTVSAVPATTYAVTATSGSISGTTSNITSQPLITETLAQKIIALVAPAFPTLADYSSRGFDWYIDEFKTNGDLLWTACGAQWDGCNNIAQYDRPLFYYYFWIITGEDKWRDRANETLINWRDAAQAAGWSTAPHQTMAEALWAHWIVTGDTASKQAILEIASRTGLAFYDSAYMGLSQGENRIQTRVIDILWMAERADPSGPWGGFMETAIANTLATQNSEGYFPFAQTCGGQLNYMGALLMDLLTRIHDQRPRAVYNAKIEEAVRKFVNWEWNTQWRGALGGLANQSFNYVSILCPGTGGPSDALDLNAMFTPMFGWLGRLDNEPAWFTRGDQIFATIQSAFLGNRQFSENFHSSFRYLGYKFGF